MLIKLIYILRIEKGIGHFLNQESPKPKEAKRPRPFKLNLEFEKLKSENKATNKALENAALEELRNKINQN